MHYEKILSESESACAHPAGSCRTALIHIRELKDDALKQANRQIMNLVFRKKHLQDLPPDISPDAPPHPG